MKRPESPKNKSLTPLPLIFPWLLRMTRATVPLVFPAWENLLKNTCVLKAILSILDRRYSTTPLVLGLKFRRPAIVHGALVFNGEWNCWNNIRQFFWYSDATVVGTSTRNEKRTVRRGLKPTHTTAMIRDKKSKTTAQTQSQVSDDQAISHKPHQSNR